MEDAQIISLYWSRSEDAISETAAKYGGFCHSIAYNILSSHEDAQECVNDTYLDTWNLIPPNKPTVFSAFLGKITRHIAIDRWRKCSAQKRGGGEIMIALEELEECLPGTGSPQQELEALELEALIRRFLLTLPVSSRILFLKRYWALEPIQEISAEMGISVSNVKSNLHRTRKKLRKLLNEVGYYAHT